jgi:hypothetical protein
MWAVVAATGLDYHSEAILPLPDRIWPRKRVNLLLFEPDILHSPPIEDTVDHKGQPFNVWLPTRPVAAVENDRSSIVLSQLPFDLPH